MSISTKRINRILGTSGDSAFIDAVTAMRESGLFACSDADHGIETLGGLLSHAAGRKARTCNAVALVRSLVGNGIPLGQSSGRGKAKVAGTAIVTAAEVRQVADGTLKVTGYWPLIAARLALR